MKTNIETIEVVLISNNCRVIDIVESELWEESQDCYPDEWDASETITVPKKEWEDEKINPYNYKKYMI